jgi:hypothetical protein
MTVRRTVAVIHNFLSSNELSHVASDGVTTGAPNDGPYTWIGRDCWIAGRENVTNQAADVSGNSTNEPTLSGANDGADPANTNGRRIFAKRTHCDRTGGWKSKIPNAFGGRG